MADRLKILSGGDWEDFVSVPAGVLVLGKSDCEHCIEWSAELEAKLEDDVDLVMNIDVQGVASVQEAARNKPMIGQRLVTVFIMPASFDELKERLRGRGKDDKAEISRRIESAEKEVEQWRSFDYFLLSKSKAEDFTAITSIWQAEKRRVARYL